MEMTKMKIGVAALHFPLTMARYMWEAFEDREDCEVYSTGPFFGNYIPWANGIRLENRYVKIPTIPLPEQSARIPTPYKLVENSMPDDLDLFVSIDAGWHFSTRPKAKVVVLIKTDPHAIPVQHYDQAATYSDIIFNMQTPYLLPGEHYLPYAYSKKYHYDEEVAPIYDACLVGLHYKERDELVNALRSKKYNVYYSIGEVYDKYRHVYNQSKVALSWSSQQDLCARNWEGLAMRRVLVANRVPDMDRFFVDGEDYLGFSNLQDAVSKVEWALNNPEEANKIADSGWSKVRPHTWDERVSQILKDCGLL